MMAAVDEDTLFSDEIKTIKEGRDLLAVDGHESVPWRSHYERLLGKYQKLVAQTRRLVRMGDAAQKDLATAREAAEFEATHDFLTRLWNRAAILDTLRKEIARHRREDRPLSLIMADIDHFKLINDSYGHMAGDAVLREASRRLESHVRPYDFVGRFGGEEFVVVAPGCDEQDAYGLAERLRLSFAEAPLSTGDGVFEVTLSLGAATVKAGEHGDPDSIIRRADEALYRAKNGGRNRAQLWQMPTFLSDIPGKPGFY